MIISIRVRAIFFFKTVNLCAPDEESIWYDSYLQPVVGMGRTSNESRHYLAQN